MKQSKQLDELDERLSAVYVELFSITQDMAKIYEFEDTNIKVSMLQLISREITAVQQEIENEQQVLNQET